MQDQIQNQVQNEAFGNPFSTPVHYHNGADAPILAGGSTGQIQYNKNGMFAGSSVMAFSGSTLTILGTLKLKEGLSSSTANIGGVIFDHYTSVGNSNTSETDLYSDTLPASSLGTNGDKIKAEYGGSFVSSATATRQIRIYFGGNSIFDTGTLTLSLSSAWTAYVTIIRVSSTVIRYMVSFTTEGAALAAYTAVGEITGLTLSNTNVLKITGQAAGTGAASSDIVAKIATVFWYPAA